jgi:hypothetical protein
MCDTCASSKRNKKLLAANTRLRAISKEIFAAKVEEEPGLGIERGVLAMHSSRQSPEINREPLKPQIPTIHRKQADFKKPY